MQRTPLVDWPAVDEIRPDPEHRLREWLMVSLPGQVLVLSAALFALVGIGTALAGWQGAVLGAGAWSFFAAWYSSATD